MDLPVMPPIEPMLAKAADALPDGDAWLYEPKWDGFRAIVFRDGSELYLQSRDLKPLDRYFPELVEPLLAALPERCVLDGEIVIAGDDRLDFEALLLRIHPAASRVAMLAEQSPASFVAFDVLALDDEAITAAPQEERRAALEEALAGAIAGGLGSVHLTPMTRDRVLAADWFDRFEGAGLDGVVAKEAGAPYEPGRRRMLKVKHARTADCVVAGFRWHKNGRGTHVGSLILGLYDDVGELHHVGVTSSFTWGRRAELVAQLEPWREGALEDHPWREWADWSAPGPGIAMPGATSRWNRGKDLSWEPLRLGLVCEVAYDHLQGVRFRHATTFRRWRPDKAPVDCRFDQLETTAPYELADIFGTR
jgi:ATP-dependent DNA ligase